MHRHSFKELTLALTLTILTLSEVKLLTIKDTKKSTSSSLPIIITMVTHQTYSANYLKTFKN